MSDGEATNGDELNLDDGSQKKIKKLCYWR